MKKLVWLFILFLLGLFSLFFSLIKGSTLISHHQLMMMLFSEKQDPLVTQIVVELRLPRTLAAFVAGGLLSLAGALMQVLLRNPLADPYVLGISGGAAVAVLVGMLCGLGGYELTGCAWLGSLLATLLILMLAKWQRGWQSDRVLLMGIALASGFSALISFILLISPDRELHGMLFWLVGDLSYAHWPWLEMAILIVALCLSFHFAKALNILVRGEKEAQALGIHSQRLQIQIYVLSSLLTGAGVALAGCIGFVGLIVPHLLRLLIGYDHRWLLPGSVLLGGSLLTVADTFSRALFAPQQLPVGIMMAMLGIPVFLFLLQKNRV